MRKKQTKIIVGILLVVTILFILGSQGFIKLPFAIGSGFTTLGISNVQFTSNDPLVGGQAWVLTVSQNGVGQSAYGDYGTIADASGKSSDPFTISISLDKNYATYNIYSQGVFIKTVEYTSTTYNPFSSSYGCNRDVWHNWIKPGGTTKVFCYNYVNEGVYGTLGNANINFQSTVSISGKSGADSLIISNNGATSGISQNGNIQASWFGNFVSGESAPSPSGQGIIAIYDTSTGGWKTGNQNSYTNWKNYDVSGLSACLGTSGSSGGTCFDNYNNYANTLMSGYQFKTVGGDVATTSGTQSNGIVNLNLPKQLQFPGITMRIKAGFIGINIPVGKPQIVSTDSLVFSTGQTGNIAVTVKNVGTADGSFDIFATCSEGFSQTGGSLRTTISAGQTGTVYIPITSNVVSGTKYGSCTVTAKDVNNPNNYDTKSVSVSSSSISICTEGQISIIGNKIQECQGNVWKTIKQCASTETAKYVNGVPDCVVNKLDNKGFFGNLFSKIGDFFKGIGGFFKGIFNFTGDIYSILKSIVILIVFVFSLLFGKDLIGSFKSLRRKQWVAWLISLVIAGALAYFVWKVFFVGLIIFIAFIIIKFAIKLTPIGRFMK